MIRKMRNSDARAVIDIYAKGLETRNATFETSVPTWEKWDASHHGFCRFVFVEAETVTGWIALSPVSKRDCYAGAAELSIYVDTDHLGKGAGSKLMAHLLPESEKHGIWTIHSSIFPENTATLRLHKRFGFREVGIRDRIAQLDGQWRSTLILERRSKVVGV